MNTDKLIRTIHPEVRVVDLKLGLVDYVASDETLDCYREIIRAEGWRFNRFEKNAPFVNSHNYDSIDQLLGRVVDFKVEGRKLIERVQWAIDVPEQPLARLGFSMTEKGYLPAVSVGFIPTKAVDKWTPQEFAVTLQELGIDAETAKQVQRVFLEQEQIELSACIIGANPNALARAHKDGAITDADLDSIGLDDDAMFHLSLIDEQASPYLAGLIAADLRRSMRQTLSKKTQPDSPADNRAEADESKRREEFLRELKTATESK